MCPVAPPVVPAGVPAVAPPVSRVSSASMLVSTAVRVPAVIMLENKAAASMLGCDAGEYSVKHYAGAPSPA